MKARLPPRRHRRLDGTRPPARRPVGVHPTVRLLKAGSWTPPEAEVAANPRASSARLRAVEKLDARPPTPTDEHARHADRRAMTATARPAPDRGAAAVAVAPGAPPPRARVRRSDRTTSGWSLRRSGSGAALTPGMAVLLTAALFVTLLAVAVAHTVLVRARCASTSSTPSSSRSRRATRSCAPRWPSSSRPSASCRPPTSMGMVTPDDLLYLQPPAPDASTVGPTTGDDDEPAADPTVGAEPDRRLGRGQAAAGGARAMTPVGPSRHPHAAPRPPPGDAPNGAPRPAARRRGGAARAPRRAPAARARAYDRPLPSRPGRHLVGRRAGPGCASCGALLVLARRLRRHRRAARRGAGARRRRVHDLRRVAAVPGHHPARPTAARSSTATATTWP